MIQTKARGDNFLTDFFIQARLSVEFNGPDSLLVLAEDENEGQSDCETMAEILAGVKHNGQSLHHIMLSDDETLNIDSKDEDFIEDPFLKKNWNIELLAAPELSHITHFCYASHALFCDTLYSLSDIIRTNDFCSEVEVTHRNRVRN